MDYTPSSEPGPSRASFAFSTQAQAQTQAHASFSRPGHSNPGLPHMQHQHRSQGSSAMPPQSMGSNTPFEIFDWYPQHLSCQAFFLNHAQHTDVVQALCAFINISLPFQKSPPILSSSTTTTAASSSPASSHPSSHRGSIAGLNLPSPFPHSSSAAAPSTYTSGTSPGPHVPGVSSRTAAHGVPGSPVGPPGGGVGAAAAAAAGGSGSLFVSLTPYIRRLVATGFDTAPILHGFFGDNWPAGVGPVHEIERRNYLFAAKSSNWLKVKSAYDGAEENETVPFLKPLQGVVEREIRKAEESWSEWLAMQDWMVGERGIDLQQSQAAAAAHGRQMGGLAAGFGRPDAAERMHLGGGGMSDRMDEEGDMRIKSEPR